MQSNGHDLSRYAGLVQELARHAFEIVEDGSPHRPRTGETRYSLIEMLPTAYALISGESQKTEPPPTDQPCTFVDGRGHSRPVYRYLAAYLHHRKTGEPPPPVTLAAGDDVALRLWSHWHRLASGRGDLEAIDRIVESHAGSLHGQSSADPPDHWTYRELTGLHALNAMVEFSESHADVPARPRWRQRVLEVTDYHQHHTQPDYTTYQPWALAAFLSNPDTIMFAEQQLHDVQTHLRIEGGAGALLPALLLADASVSILS